MTRSGLRRRATLVVTLLMTTAACGSSRGASPATTTESTTATTQASVAATASSGATDSSAATSDATSGTAGDTTDGTTDGSVVLGEPEAAPVMPVTVTDDTGHKVTVESPERIVPVDGDLAEIVFALGLGDDVVATDLSATYPPEADAKPSIGYQRALNAEPITAFEPTVVLATDLARPLEALQQLRAVGISVVVVDRGATIDGPVDKVRAVAAALGVPNRGEALIAQMEAQMQAATTAAAAATDHPRALALYLRGDSTQLIFGKGTGIDVLIPLVGAVDVAAELGVVDTQQITAEALVEAAPDVILVTTTGLESVGGIDGLLQIPGIAETPAGQNRRILAYEDQYLYGGGPRVGLLMADLVRVLHTPNP